MANKHDEMKTVAVVAGGGRTKGNPNPKPASVKTVSMSKKPLEPLEKYVPTVFKPMIKVVKQYKRDRD